MSSQAPLIIVQNVRQTYGIRPVLQDVSFEVRSGEIVCVMGPNGMGKTTLLSVLGGALSPQQGQVLINGMQRRSSVDVELEIRRRVVYLPDKPWLPKSHTGREYLMAVGRLYRIEPRRLLDQAQRLLELFQLEDRSDAPIRTYSAGQQKKIALAGALVTDCDTMILDEPFSGGLDPSGLLSLRRVLLFLAKSRGVTIVMASPVPEIADGLADRLMVLVQGRVAGFDTADGLRRATGCDGTIAEVLEQLINPHTEERISRYLEGEP